MTGLLKRVQQLEARKLPAQCTLTKPERDNLVAVEIARINGLPPEEREAEIASATAAWTPNPWISFEQARAAIRAAFAADT
jgi:hypothetical protein